MGDKSAIEWTDATWNPTTGCDRVSPGCDNCYALTLAARLKAMGQARYQNDGDPRTSGPGFALTLHPDSLDLPLRWTRPRMVFVNSMSDLFHPRVPDDYIARVFAAMARTPRHTYQILTKRPPRMRALLNSPNWRGTVAGHVRAALPDQPLSAFDEMTMPFVGGEPLRNVWGGVSVEDQERADQRIGYLMDTPLRVRWLSMEPLLGPVELPEFVVAGSPDCPCESGRDCPPNVDWVVVGGESGPGHRTVEPRWVRSIRDQCLMGGIPFFFKQWGGIRPKSGGRELDGHTWDQLPLAAAAR
jgi:protein gp37